MRTRKSKRDLRSHSLDKAPRRLAIEPLETRRLLASLTSQLPAIIITGNSEPVQIRQHADPTREISLPSAAVSALEELASLQHIFSDLRLYRDEGGLLAGLQKDVWSPAAAALQDESFEPLELAAALEIATQGFEAVNPPPELAAERIFGPSLSETKLVSRTNNAADARNAVIGNDAVGNDTLQIDLAQAAVSQSSRFAASTADVASNRESGEVASQNNSASAETAAQGEAEMSEIGAVQRRTVSDEQNNEEGIDRESKTNDMLLLPQPTAGASVPKINDTDRPDAESQSGTENEDAGVALAGEAVLGQMLLLPMVPDSSMDHEYAGPTLIAGFNPVAMLQIFVGNDLGAARYDEVELRAGIASGVGETDVASSPLVRGDRLAVAVFVIVAGYWYFHPGDERTLLATAWNSAIGDHGASGGAEKPFGRR